jgi:hypothetical protein
MQRSILLALLGLTLLLNAAPTAAGALQKQIKSRWLGAWVVTRVDLYSDCGPLHTNNRIHGELVKSNGAHRFHDGELARLNKVDLNRSRLDLMLSLNEPILVPAPDGPFTLYRELSCKVELEVELSRDLVKAGQVAEIERAMLRVIERHTNEDSARASELYNDRRRDPYPDDYDQTLHAHAVWQAEQVNAAVLAKIERAKRETREVADRITTDPDYLAGFLAGVEEAKSADLNDCSRLMAVDFELAPHRTDDPRQARIDRGAADGRNLIYSLALDRYLPDCMVSPPEPPPGS